MKRSAVRQVLRAIAPPALVAWARRLHPEWRYVGSSAGALDGVGWEHPSVAAAQLRKWPQWIDIVNSKGPLGVAHEAPVLRTDSIAAHNIVLTFAYVLTLASRGKAAISVLDWGGGLGQYHALAQALVPDVALRYTVMEVAPTVEAGRRLGTTTSFVASSEAIPAAAFDLVMASGSIQFARDWEALLVSLVCASREHFYVARVPVVREAASFVAAQRAHRYGYHTEYRGWCLNRRDLLAAVDRAGGELVREFALEEHPPIAGAPEQPTGAGFLFRRRAGG